MSATILSTCGFILVWSSFSGPESSCALCRQKFKVSCHMRLAALGPIRASFATALLVKSSAVSSSKGCERAAASATCSSGSLNTPTLARKGPAPPVRKQAANASMSTSAWHSSESRQWQTSFLPDRDSRMPG